MKCPNCGRENPDGAKFCGGCGSELTRRKGKRWKWLIGGAAVICLVAAAGAALLWGNVAEQEAAADFSEFIVTYENGDTVCTPGEESLAYDEASHTVYYENLLVVYLNTPLTEEEAEALAARVDGAVVGQLTGAVNLLQIAVPPCDFERLNAYADTLMETDQVLYAACEIPVEMEETSDTNRWCTGLMAIEDKGDEASPGGNDWWAEAVKAYTVWDYVDYNRGDLADVTVGVLDSGFDADHTEFTSKVFDPSTMMNVDYCNITVLNTNSESDHGTHVAGIIAAQNNSGVIRGIADTASLVCIDWRQEETDEAGNTTERNLLSCGGYAALLKQLVENDAQVINNSWGTVFHSQEEYEKDETLSGTFESYEDYTLQMEAYAENSSQRCMALIAALLASRDETDGGRDFLLVFAAGNGYDNGGPGYPASLCGYFGQINEENYEKLTEQNPEQFSRLGYTFDDIREHILVVGAVENVTEDGKYLMTSFSNYGSDVVDICAPGKDIYSAVVDGYEKCSGTSMAAPMVSGAAALVWSLDPSLTAGEVKDILVSNVDGAVGVTGEDAGETYPMLNVASAMQTAAPARVTEIVVEDQSDTGSGYVYIVAYGEDGYAVWKHKTSVWISTYDETELPRVSEIGWRGNAYYYVEDGTVTALHANTGALLWENDEFGGSGYAVLGENGIYLCGYYGPDFYAVSYSGNTLLHIDTFDTSYFWAYKIEVEENVASVYLSGSDDSELTAPFVFHVNLLTGEYTMASSSRESGLAYEMVERYDSAETSDGRQVVYASSIYPSFTGTGAEGLNEYIESTLPQWVYQSTYEQQGGDALYEEYLEVYSDVDDLWDYLPFYDEFEMKVCAIGDDFIELAYRTGMWFGGVHPYSYYYSVSYDLTTGQAEVTEIDRSAYDAMGTRMAGDLTELFPLLSDFDAFDQAVSDPLTCDSVEEPDEDFIDIMLEVGNESYDELWARYTCYNYTSTGMEARFTGTGGCVYLKLENPLYSVCGAFVGQTKESLRTMTPYESDGEQLTYTFGEGDDSCYLYWEMYYIEVSFDADDKVSSIQVQDIY